MLSQIKLNWFGRMKREWVGYSISFKNSILVISIVLLSRRNLIGIIRIAAMADLNSQALQDPRCMNNFFQEAPTRQSINYNPLTRLDPNHQEMHRLISESKILSNSNSLKYHMTAKVKNIASLLSRANPDYRADLPYNKQFLKVQKRSIYLILMCPMTTGIETSIDFVTTLTVSMTQLICKNWENRDKDSILLKMINCIIPD